MSPSRSLWGCGVPKTLVEPVCDQRLEGNVVHNRRRLSNFLLGSARMNGLELLSHNDQSKGHRHCSIGHEDSHVKSWPWSELTLASYRPAHGEDQGHGRTTIGATVDRDLPFK